MSEKYQKTVSIQFSFLPDFGTWRSSISSQQLSTWGEDAIGHFSSPKNSHFQNETKCKNFLVWMNFICKRINNHFLDQWLRTSPRFEAGVLGNSESAHWQSVVTIVFLVFYLTFFRWLWRQEGSHGNLGERKHYNIKDWKLPNTNEKNNSKPGSVQRPNGQGQTDRPWSRTLGPHYFWSLATWSTMRR